MNLVGIMIDVDKILYKCTEQFEYIDYVCEKNSLKVLESFRRNKVEECHFAPSNGYGYGNVGRDTLNQVFADSLGFESALVNANFVSGTHAISTALFGVAKPGDSILFITGTPYDTLDKVINGTRCGSLNDFGIKSIIRDYKTDDINIELEKKPNIVYIQRSRGYSLRSSLRICEINKLISKVRSISPESIIIVDNCYGEFVEELEPDADLIVGSLIKNPGAGIAPSGGYISGKRNLVSLCEQRLLAPGLKDIGSSTYNRELFMGLFYAPLAVRESLKSAVFASALFEEAGFEVFPKFNEVRADIVSSINLRSEENLKIFCKSIQEFSPVDSFLTPEPWRMPGYSHDVIMAAGGFISGSSIELSADAPVREPYTVWFQGGTNFYLAKYALTNAYIRIKKI